jgi:ribosomal protein S6
MSRNYEVAFLLKEGELAKVAVERIKEYFSKAKASILSENDMGTRQLAYPIHRNRENFSRAFYYFVKAEMSPDSIIKLEKQIKFDEEIIRHMVLAE